MGMRERINRWGQCSYLGLECGGPRAREQREEYGNKLYLGIEKKWKGDHQRYRLAKEMEALDNLCTYKWEGRGLHNKDTCMYAQCMSKNCLPLPTT